MKPFPFLSAIAKIAPTVCRHIIKRRLKKMLESRAIHDVRSVLYPNVPRAVCLDGLIEALLEMPALPDLPRTIDLSDDGLSPNYSLSSNDLWSNITTHIHQGESGVLSTATLAQYIVQSSNPQDTRTTFALKVLESITANGGGAYDHMLVPLVRLTIRTSQDVAERSKQILSNIFHHHPVLRCPTILAVSKLKKDRVEIMLHLFLIVAWSDATNVCDQPNKERDATLAVRLDTEHRMCCGTCSEGDLLPMGHVWTFFDETAGAATRGDMESLRLVVAFLACPSLEIQEQALLYLRDLPSPRWRSEDVAVAIQSSFRELLRGMPWVARSYTGGQFLQALFLIGGQMAVEELLPASPSLLTTVLPHKLIAALDLANPKWRSTDLANRFPMSILEWRGDSPRRLTVEQALKEHREAAARMRWDEVERERQEERKSPEERFKEAYEAGR